MKSEGNYAFTVARSAVIGLLLAASLNGCKKKDADNTADTVRATAQPASATPAAATATPAVFHGLLGAPAGATATYVSNLDFSTPDAADYIHDDVDCDPGDDAGCVSHGNGRPKTRRIVGIPERNSHLVNWDEILKADKGDSGYIVLKLTNQGSDSKNWKLKKGEDAYLWVGPDTSGKKVVAVYKIDRTTGYADELLTAKVARYCDDIDADPAHPKHRNAHFFPKKDGHCGASTAANHMKPMYERSHQSYQKRLPSGAGLWVSCSNGCCEATYLEGAN